MANRLGRSFYRFSSVNRPVQPPTPTPTQTESSSSSSASQNQNNENNNNNKQIFSSSSEQPTSPKRVFYSPTKQSPPSSPTYVTRRSSLSPPPKPTAESPTFKSSNRPGSPPPVEVVEQKPMIYKTAEKPPAKSFHSQTQSKINKPTTDVINIAGENLGAVMEIVQSSNKRGVGHVIKKKDTKGTHSSIDEDENGGNFKDKGSHKGKETTTLPASTFMNSNFQTVNNCILYKASLTDHDPGLHIVFSRKPTGHGFAMEDKKHIIKS